MARAQLGLRRLRQQRRPGRPGFSCRPRGSSDRVVPRGFNSALQGDLPGGRRGSGRSRSPLPRRSERRSSSRQLLEPVPLREPRLQTADCVGAVQLGTPCGKTTEGNGETAPICFDPLVAEPALNVSHDDSSGRNGPVVPRIWAIERKMTIPRPRKFSASRETGMVKW